MLHAQLAPHLPSLYPSPQIVDAWWHGLPVLTTPLGAEGMQAADAEPERPAAPQEPDAGGELFPDPAAEGFIWQLRGGIDAGLEDAPRLRQPEEAGEEWGGLCGATTAATVAATAALLYSDERLWRGCQRRGFSLLRQLYDRERNLERVLAAVGEAQRGLEARRRGDWVGAMLWLQQLRASEYFSRW